MKKYIIYIILLFKLFFITDFSIVNAAIGDIGHWRDSIGGQIPATTFGGFNFDSEIRNDGIYTKPNNSTIQVNEAGDYLIISTTNDIDTSNGRYNSQLRISQIVGTGDIFSSNYTGYSRDNSENTSWTRAIGIVIGASANSQFQVQKRRDTDAPTGGSVINSSDLQVIKIDKSNYGIYSIAGVGNSYGGITPNTLDITSIINESDINSIQANITTDTINIKGDNKKYLTAWSVSFDGSGNNRTQRVGHLEFDGIDKLSTSSYCYMRNSANQYCGLGSMDIIQTSTTDVLLQAEVFRGIGVLADQGGANNDGTMVTDGNGQIIILEMPDSLEVFSSQDSVGLQDITTAQTLNIARDINFNSPTSFTKLSNTQVSVTNPADIFSWANIWTARQNVTSGSRLTSYGSIIIDGVEQTTGRHGSYSRGNQGTTDTFAMSFNPAGIFTTTGVGSTLGVNTNPLAGTEGGGNDRTQAGTLGFFAINLDTLTPPVPILNVLYADNDIDNIVQTNQIVEYSLDINNSTSDATGISAIATIDTNFGIPYGFTYSNCGSPNESFILPNLTFSNISILGGNTCNIKYFVQVDALAIGGSIITSSVDVGPAIEGGNDPAIVSGDNLTVIACSVNDVEIIFETDDYGEDTFWSLVPNGNTCGVGEISNGGNPNLDCTSGGAPATAGAGDPYADASIITEGPFSLTVGNQYDLHVIDDYGDGITIGAGATDPDIRINQNGAETNSFSVLGDGGVFSFTVQQPSACIDTVNPEVSINQAPSQVDPTTTNSATFQVVFNEPINVGTFTSGDITISGTTGIITSGPTQLAPNNGTTFEVVVTGMNTGDIVTVNIPAGVIEDLAGNLNNISTFIDNQVTYNGIPSNIGPGGVNTNLELWLKSNLGTSTTTDGNNLTLWSDQSGKGLDASAVVAPVFRNNVINNLNFYPVIDFDGSTQYMSNLANGTYSNSYYTVIIPDNKIDGTLAGQVPFGFDCNSGILSSGTCGLSFAGLTLGAFTVAINDEVITHALGSSTNRRSSQIGVSSYGSGQAMLIGVNENALGNNSDIYEKGLKIDNFTANTYQTLSAADYSIGRSLDGGNPFPYDGKIAEIINFSTKTSNIDRQKIESYLGLKYGITLNSGNQNYISSDGVTNMWDSSLAGIYKNNVFGIGRDDSSVLSQIKSKSSNNDSILTIEAIGEGTNLSPSFIDINDKEFLTISNDLGGNTWTPIDSPIGYNILSRKWRVQETGELGTINLDFDVSNIIFDVPVLTNGTGYYFVYDSNNDNSLGDETPQIMNNISGNIWQISGINLNNLREFTIATQASTNNIPTDISISNNIINENLAAGSLIGSFTTSDPDLGDTHTYSLVTGAGDSENIYFSIIGDSLFLNHSPDFEIRNSYSIRIQTDDGNGGQYQKIFSININNILETFSSIIDFEDPLNNYKYSVTSGNWTETTTLPNEGLFSMESNNGGINNTQSCFEVFHTFGGTGTINFDYDISSEAGSDFLRFYIDNIEQQGWSGIVPWTTYSNINISSGLHSYKWCYIKDGAGAGGTDNAFIDYITYTDSLIDVNPPVISSTNFNSGSLLPGGNHNIIINYSDDISGIDILSDNISVNKWNGTTWGSDIGVTALNLGSKVITTTQAEYTTNNLGSGKYRYNFSISDINGNTSSISIVFYIDIPELIISTGSLDIGDISPGTTNFSNDEIIIQVKTIGAEFELQVSKDTTFADGFGNIIINFDGIKGVGYDKLVYTNIIKNFGTNQILASEIQNIDQNGLIKTYEYRIKIGNLIDSEQAAGNYSMDLSFPLIINY